MAASTPENLVKAKLKKIFRDYHVLSYSVPQNGLGNAAGFPDRACYAEDGVHFVVECKAADKKLRPLQERWRQRLEDRDVFYFIYDATPETEKELVNFLTQHTNVL